MARKYTVKKGDNPSTLAEKFFGSQRFFNIIQDAAGGGILQPGMVLRLPDRGSVDTSPQGIRTHNVSDFDIAVAQRNQAAIDANRRTSGVFGTNESVQRVQSTGVRAPSAANPSNPSVPGALGGPGVTTAQRRLTRVTGPTQTLGGGGPVPVTPGNVANNQPPPRNPLSVPGHAGGFGYIPPGYGPGATPPTPPPPGLPSTPGQLNPIGAPPPPVPRPPRPDPTPGIPDFIASSPQFADPFGNFVPESVNNIPGVPPATRRFAPRTVPSFGIAEREGVRFAERTGAVASNVVGGGLSRGQANPGRTIGRRNVPLTESRDVRPEALAGEILTEFATLREAFDMPTDPSKMEIYLDKIRNGEVNANFLALETRAHDWLQRILARYGSDGDVGVADALYRDAQQDLVMVLRAMAEQARATGTRLDDRTYDVMRILNVVRPNGDSLSGIDFENGTGYSSYRSGGRRGGGGRGGGGGGGFVDFGRNGPQGQGVRSGAGANRGTVLRNQEQRFRTGFGLVSWNL